MIFSRQDHAQFLEEELQSITDAFKKKLETQAITLLQEKGELFVAQFITFRENGEMLLKFPNTRQTPRKGDYLYCFTVPKEFRDYRNWGTLTYGDLLKKHNQHSEGIICVWQEPFKGLDGIIDERFSIVAFRGVDTVFAHNIAPWQFVENIQNSNSIASLPEQLIRNDGIILLLGPNKPPFEYISNLQKIVENSYVKEVCTILDNDFKLQNNLPKLLDSQYDIGGFLINQFSLNDTIILHGPPGTGKTYLISQICETLCKVGKSVLVTALTNRALIEVAEKPSLSNLLKEKKIFKTKLTTDETQEIKGLQDIAIKDISPKKGELILSTFYISSMLATQGTSDIGQKMITDYESLENEVFIHKQGGIEYHNFDIVIVDEASQAFLSTLAMSKILGKNTIWVGDCKQLSPIILLNEDRINAKKWNLLSDGFFAVTNYTTIPFYQLSDSFRLSNRATDFTGIFYSNVLKSKINSDNQYIYSDIPKEISQFLNPKGGPTLLKTDLKRGEKTPKQAIDLTIKIVTALMRVNPQLKIAVLNKFIVTVKALQKAMNGNYKNLIIETIDRVQGLTTDVTIFIISNTSLNYSLEPRLFNVATSRAKSQTIIICDKETIDYPHIDSEVKYYLQKLDSEFSFYINEEKTVFETSNNIAQTRQKNLIQPNILGYVDLSKFEKPKEEST